MLLWIGDLYCPGSDRGACPTPRPLAAGGFVFLVQSRAPRARLPEGGIKNSGKGVI